jgi:gliding motility-associated-like protein
LRKSLFILLLLFVNLANAQLVVNSSLTAAQLVQNFIGGGVTVSNISYTGGVTSNGSFSNGNTTNLGLSSGIVLCTGLANQISSPASFLMSSNLGLGGDANLNAISNGAQTYDACILQFDFVPLSDTIKFKYVFGSEEYPNYICSQYNDVFAFFVNGPIPGGGNYNNYNIALIPGTNVPVSVNSVNSGTPGSGYNASGCTSLGYSSYFVNNSALGGTTIAFGGFTKPLVAKCHVIPCQTYHLKMAVADGYNGLYDSGVFLEANSFSSNTVSAHNSYTNTFMGQNAIEGCGDAIVSLITPAPLTTSYTINYTISGSAVNGTDYTSIPNSITIPAGQDSVGLIIHPLTDNITEGTENIIISFDVGCVTIHDTINILDHVNLNVNAGSDTIICNGNSAILNTTVSGGIGPIQYAWSSGAGSGSQITVMPSANTPYAVTVSDNCAFSATDTVLVTVDPGIIVSASASPPSICNGATSVLSATGAASYSWIPGILTGSTLNVTPSSNTTYTVTGSSSGGCSGTATVSVAVTNVSLAVSSAPENCGHRDGSASVVVSGNCNGASSYLWNTTPVQSTDSAIGLSAGNYSITVTCSGCTSSASVTVSSNAGPAADFIAYPMATSITNPNISFMDITNGNVVSWLWDLGDGTSAVQSSFRHTYGHTGSYTVTLTITDTHGCTDNVSKTITVNDFYTLYIPNTFTPNDDHVNDVFTPFGTNIDGDHFEMMIFNRWGSLVYDTKKWNGNSCDGWNGAVNNKGSYEKAVAGVYVYKIHAGNSMDGYKNYFGEIILVP